MCIRKGQVGVRRGYHCVRVLNDIRIRVYIHIHMTEAVYLYIHVHITEEDAIVYVHVGMRKGSSRYEKDMRLITCAECCCTPDLQ